MSKSDKDVWIKIGGKLRKFRLVVLRVNEELENGKPDVVTIGREETVFELSRDETQNRFYIGFISAEGY